MKTYILLRDMCCIFFVQSVIVVCGGISPPLIKPWMYCNAPIDNIKYLLMIVMYVCIHDIYNCIANGIIIYLFVSCDGASLIFII